jgi:K+-sensing histidine kinase KdpD
LIYGSALRLNSLLPLGLFFFALGQTIYIALENSKHEKEELQILMELSETLDKRQNFLDQFQHHIRTPIQGMLSYVESYRADPSESQKLESLSQVLLKLTRDTEFALKGKK